MDLKTIAALLKETAKEWSEDKAPRLAAALAYYTVFSLAPLLVIVIAIAGAAFGRSAAQNQITAQVEALMGAQGAEFITSLIEGMSEPKAGIIATTIGVITLLLGAAGVFGQLRDALNTVWEVQPAAGPGGVRGILYLIQRNFLSFSMVLGTGFVLLVSLIVSAAIEALNQFAAGIVPGLGPVWQLVNVVVSLAVFALLFALIFRVLPDVHIPWRDVWLGAALTSLLFNIGKYLIGLYLGRSSIGSAFGAAGALVILLVWIYYSAQIFLFGAEFTHVYSMMGGSYTAILEKGARPLTEEARAQQGIPRTPEAEPGANGAARTPAPTRERLATAFLGFVLGIAVGSARGLRQEHREGRREL
jgi:membrane protein